MFSSKGERIISYCVFSMEIHIFMLLVTDSAMGIGGGIRQCRRKCRPMSFLRQQKKCRHKGFHICSLSFQVLQCC